MGSRIGYLEVVGEGKFLGLGNLGIIRFKPHQTLYQKLNPNQMAGPTNGSAFLCL